MSKSMYDAYLSVGKSTEDVESTVEEGVQEESLTSFLLATLSAAKVAEKVVEEEVVAEEEVIEEEEVVVEEPIDYISAYANPPIKEAVEEEEIIEDEEDVIEDEEEKVFEEEEVVEEEEEEELEEEELEEEEEEEVVEEGTAEDLAAFILSTIKNVVNPEAIDEEEEEEVVVEEEEEEEEEEEDVDPDEPLSDFILRTISQQAESAIDATEKHFDEEAETVIEHIKDKRGCKKRLAKIDHEKKEALAAIEERKDAIDEASGTIADTVLQLELVDKDAEETAEFDPEKGDKNFKNSQKALKKELEKTIKSMFKEERIATAKRIESMSGGGSGGGGGSSTLETNNISSYRCDLDVYYYSGWLVDGSTIVIKRTDGDDEQFATGLTDLETDWANRVNLTYI